MIYHNITNIKHFSKKHWFCSLYAVSVAINIKIYLKKRNQLRLKIFGLINHIEFYLKSV